MLPFQEIVCVPFSAGKLHQDQHRDDGVQAEGGRHLAGVVLFYQRLFQLGLNKANYFTE
jgi:hypothetical protein